MKQWPQRDFHAQHLFALVANLRVDLYRGAGARARRRIQDAWSAYRQVAASPLLDRQGQYRPADRQQCAGVVVWPRDQVDAGTECVGRGRSARSRAVRLRQCAGPDAPRPTRVAPRRTRLVDPSLHDGRRAFQSPRDAALRGRDTIPPGRACSQAKRARALVRAGDRNGPIRNRSRTRRP